MALPLLILVRHARPQIEPDVPPPLWRLSAEGRAAAAGLAARIAPFAPAAVLASTEPKAVETAEILAAPLGLTVAADAAFAEHHRPDWPFQLDPAAVRARVLRVLAEPALSVESAETGDAAVSRFAAGLAVQSARPLIVVTHGTVLSLYLGRKAWLEAAEFWRGLGAPEALILDADGRLIERIA
jgi:broad specificity phosphatase PhoE